MSRTSPTHTFVICAYKESQYLEECIKSLLSQTVPAKCVIATSTPNRHIQSLAKKYHLPYYVRRGKSDIQTDWNFAYNQADTELVTIAHQDDIYEPEYLQSILNNYDKQILLYNTDYIPYKNGVDAQDSNSKIKRVLKVFTKSKFFAQFRFFKVMSLAFGNTINCPSVTYNKLLLGDSVFTSELKFGLDWDTFLKIARQKGISLYIPRKLVKYRIHDDATTKKFILNNQRQKEDLIMFNKIWPSWIAKLIMKVYVKSYDTYK
ncbi:glycosyltransferase [Candidatus Saccharibacteria bacterium]|nr:glycosyltransferase [Candidatus Saccharibacteria bacterium]MBQ6130452.1 glycosyltransferase [Candidatus Saccharibacteria bacterium]